jgi:hypothetical protein
MAVAFWKGEAVMRWKNPSTKVQNILIAPLAAPIAICALPVLLVMVAIAWPVQRYCEWSQARGWHRWFAWRPVYCGDWWDEDRPRKWVWLETVSRRTWVCGDTEYRWPEQVTE